MALTIYKEKDVDPTVLRDRVVAILGYGNQGRAHALNLRDSGVNIIVGQRPGKGFDRARSDGFSPMAIEAASPAGDLLIISLPDESASEIYERRITPHLHAGQTLGFVHGFNIRFGFITPPDDVDVIMVAPKGPGTLLRSLYVEGKGLPALMAVHQDVNGRAASVALAWASCIGSTRAGVVETTFAAETETDLFGEQVVLCGGITALTQAAFETLVEAGYEPEFAYLECVHELKQIADLLYDRGMTAMRERISNTAAYGDVTRGPRMINAQTRAEMTRMLEEIRSGAFANEWIQEHRSGGATFRKLREQGADSLFEQAGRNVRALMPWLNPED